MSKLGKETQANYKRIMENLRAGKYCNNYILMGEEPFYVDRIGQYIADHALNPDEQTFNQQILYGNAVTGATVAENARRYPMMAEYQVVIVREAQQMKNPEVLAPYFSKPNPTTILVLCYMGKSVDKRSSFWKTVSAHSEVMESNLLKEDDIPDWIVGYLKEKQISIEPYATRMLSDYLGTNLGRIAMELEKLLILLPADTKTITVAMVEQGVGINREFSPFTMNEYLSERNFRKVQPIALYFGENEKTYPLVMLISLMYVHFLKILRFHTARIEDPRISSADLAKKVGTAPFFMRSVELGAKNYSLPKVVNIIDLLCQYDSRYKSSDRGEATDGELLMELICKIIN